jgi:mono/diheme cytochrome c family protein
MVLAALLALAAAGTVRAQYNPAGCYPYYGYRQYAPTYYQAPAYPPQPYYHQEQTYEQPYSPPYEKVYPAQKVLAQEIAVAPLIVTVPVDSKAVPVQAYGSPYYYSVSEAYREKAHLRDVLREELRSLLTTGGSAATTTTTTATAQAAQQTAVQGLQAQQMLAQPPPPPQVPAAVAEKSEPDDQTPAELQAKVVAAYKGKGNCLSCHGIDGQSGPKGKPFRLVLDDGKGGQVLRKLTSDRRWKIYGMASVGAMPPAAANDANKARESTHLPALLQYAAQKDN